MFNTNQMDHRRDEYIQHRQQLAERDQLARIAQSQQPTFGQRSLAIAIRLWRQRPRFIARKALLTDEAPDTLASNVLHDAG